MPAMVELLGVGASRGDGGWTLHRSCGSVRRGEVTLVVSQMPEERDALLDAVAARILPEEGRVWVAHIPVSVTRFAGSARWWRKSTCTHARSSTARSSGTSSWPAN